MSRHSVAVVAEWIQRILGHEGGLSLDGADRGNWTGGRVGEGELKGTKWGIAAHAYPNLDIPNLTIDDAADIYLRDYLAPLHADKHEDGVAYQLLDFAVNSGPGRALRALQRAVGVKPDGQVGPITLAALGQYTEAQLVMLILAERLEFMSGLSAWHEFGRGWARRIAENLRHGARDSGA